MSGRLVSTARIWAQGCSFAASWLKSLGPRGLGGNPKVLASVDGQPGVLAGI